MDGQSAARPNSTTSFAIQPELQFKFELAERLGKFVSEINRMDCVEFHWWAVHFQRKAAAEQRAINRAKRSRGRG
jgi:hypothetical protein